MMAHIDGLEVCRFEGPEYDAANGFVVEPSGRVLMTGRFWQTITMDTTQLKSAGSQDIYVVAWRP